MGTGREGARRGEGSLRICSRGLEFAWKTRRPRQAGQSGRLQGSGAAGAGSQGLSRAPGHRPEDGARSAGHTCALWPPPKRPSRGDQGPAEGLKCCPTQCSLFTELQSITPPQPRSASPALAASLSSQPLVGPSAQFGFRAPHSMGSVQPLRPAALPGAGASGPSSAGHQAPLLGQGSEQEAGGWGARAPRPPQPGDR